MELLDTRRLTGPNLVLNGAGTVLDVRCTDEQARTLLPLWEKKVRQILTRLDWTGETVACTKRFSGISLAFTAPLDALYTAAEINEWCYARCAIELGVPYANAEGNSVVLDLEEQLKVIHQALALEANPRLIQLAAMASEEQVSMLWDDDEVSLGLGKNASVWPVNALPDPQSLPWSTYDDIPVGIVTGTNGKTTTVRLISHILKGAGHSAGFSSTDGIMVNENKIDSGDWSGPGGARLLLRQTELDIAILEAARGGLLRRGLGVDHANVALITNISEDHLGDFGSENLQELLTIKWMISQTVADSGVLILNADDPLLVNKASGFNGTIVWFSLFADNLQVRQHIKNGGIAYVQDEQNLVRMQSSGTDIICAVETIPLTLGGKARHNVANALAAVAMASQLGITDSAIKQGLQSMSLKNNPGRLNLYTVEGVTVVVDYAHNPAGMQAMAQFAQAQKAARTLLAFSQPGDRPDSLIRELTRAAWKMQPDKVIVSELAHYHRGRNHGEVFAIIQDELLRCGAQKEQVSHFDEELDALHFALQCAEPGDLVVMLALADSQLIQDELSALSAAN
ncbi:Mur ligase family protein [Granulosicoccus antarcticus]|uniref:Cyanophycin synthetase n=1 Tax=Granulosicoccus antarcticus IMCC3135 TaxID=1192854 RepID=A0A2Z2NVY2_9GAMM|nr:Mur ligase family protein [Granulosicoccus antarcticus]ASJ72950.1 Cyanophycin synthetase [Granulosicoccus antarcticus IMCC3135]